MSLFLYSKYYDWERRFGHSSRCKNWSYPVVFFERGEDWFLR